MNFETEAGVAEALQLCRSCIGYATPTCCHTCADTELKEGTKVALQLAFKLPGACYATMLVRELTKTSTATAVHKKLTQQLPNNGVKDS